MERPSTPGSLTRPRSSRSKSSSKSARDLPAQQDVHPMPALSFAQRTGLRSPPSKSNIVEGNDLLRSIERPPPGDSMNRRKSLLQPGLAKKRSSYYESEFAAGREVDPSRDRVRNDAIVLAELRTNVIIQDEFTFITDLTYHLSNRYQRSVSSIVVNIQHGCCMMFGGSFDPAYTLTIFALPSLTQPVTNKRNAALIQNHVLETLGVVPSRGYVRFVATPEDDVACGGRTVAGEMEELEKVTAEAVEVGSETSKPAKSKRLSIRSSITNFRPTTPAHTGSEPLPTPPASTDEAPTMLAIPEHPPTPEIDFLAVEKTKKASRRKSFVTSLFSSKA